MNKVIRDGKVAVLVSRGCEDGWSTWNPLNDVETFLFHPKLVQMVEENRQMEITSEWIEKELGIETTHTITGGKRGLHIVWVPVGTKFTIAEHDGNETLKTIDEYKWITA